MDSRHLLVLPENYQGCDQEVRFRFVYFVKEVDIGFCVGDFRWVYDLAASFIELFDLRLRPGLINFVYELFGIRAGDFRGSTVPVQLRSSSCLTSA